jgi:hypothetical protein
MKHDPLRLQTIGWREYVALPDLGVTSIKAKVDTGARSSSLHAFELELFRKDNLDHVRFKIHPLQRSAAKLIAVETPVFDMRRVKSSSGSCSLRPVIVTIVEMMGEAWPIELTLANRDEMGFRMLLGREAIRGRMLVDSGNSYFGGVPKRKKSKPKSRKRE